MVNLILGKLNWHVKDRWWGKWEVEAATSSYEAYLHITEVAKDTFTFDLSMHNGVHVGQIAGVAQIQNKGEALYTSDEHFDDEKPCKIKFKKINNQIRVEENYGCHAYHGIRAHFDGDYKLKKDSFYYIDEVKDHHLLGIYGILGDDQ